MLNFQNVVWLENLKMLFSQVGYGHKKHWSEKY
ncbi:hypothetical protein AAA799O18_00671 [Marine Group I thaumarchaeote SCGC AAA799-O18]|jgi:hypothetical protein|nr:hypothetical protein AAA799O18_00671 [Marine Group I thaumarchaeote SCGC AAA799-O18]